jgi:benzylsuccinate CoA-transferase BbsF subunit
VTGPLDGVRVIDLGWTWAGPYAGMILCDLGADVIKVESTTRIDMLRFSGAFADGVRDPERSAWHGSTNRGKRSLTVDLKHPEGRQLVLDLVANGDVVIENFAPRVLPELGLGWDDLQAVNPQLVMLSLAAYGAVGPDSDFIAYGDHLTYASGLASTIGVEGDPATPINTFYGDPVAGMFGALAIVAALEERDLIGGGGHLEYSQVEGLLAMIPATIARHATDRPQPRLGDKSETMAPHGFYRCAGTDAWVAIAVEDDLRWAQLRGLLVDDGIHTEALATFADRKAQEPSVDASITTWTSTQSPWEVTARCQRAGVAAYPMMDAAMLARDTHLHERGFFAHVDHPVMGPSPIPGVVFRIGGDGAQVRGPAPMLGQHNEEVLREVLGLDAAQIDRLRTERVLR